MKTNWPTKKLREVCDLAKSGVDFFDGKKEYIDTGSLINGNIISFETVTYEKRPSRANMEITTGDILVAKMKDTLKVYLTTSKDEKNRIFSTGFFVFKPKNNLVISKYLFFYFISPIFQDLKNALSHGATQKAINNQDIEKYFEIPLPPFEVQKKIVAKLESLLAKVSEVKKLRAEARESADNLLSAELHKIFEEGKEKGWEEKELGKVVEIQSGFGFPKDIQGRTGEKYPFLKVSDMNLPGNEEEIMAWNNTVGDEDIKRKGYKVAPAGTIIFPKIGGAIATNKKRILTKESIYDNNVMGLIPSKEISNRFLFYWLNGFDLSNWAAGSSLPAITQSRVTSTKIVIPPIGEQKKIVARLDSISQKIQAVKELQNETEDDFGTLESSVLSKAFSGKLIKERATAQQPIPSPFCRNQANAAIIEQVTADNGSTTEVAIAKHNHLLQEICGVPLRYEFAESKFGPFDAKIKSLIWSGLGKNKWFTKNRGMVVEGQNVGALLAKRTNLYWNAKAGMKQLAELGITKLNAEKVELLSTVYHSIKQVGSADLQKVRGFMSNWQTNGNQTKADKFSEEQTQKCLDFIIKNELHKKLI